MWGSRISAWFLDLVLLVSGAATLIVAATGGGAFTLASIRISLTSTGNPVALAALAAAARYLAYPRIPFLWFPRRTPEALDAIASRIREELLHHGRARAGSARILAVIVIGSILLRLANALAYPGFVTGDDVEIHQMTLGVLFDTGWPVWELRCALYPMAIIYPAQSIVHRLGGEDVGTLILAGRLVVVALATVSVWLTYRIALALTGSEPAALLAAIMLATSRLHVWFGSGELPRPVASVFLLAAFWVLLKSGSSRAIGAGLLLGIGGALRFGEVIFFVPAVIWLLWRRRVWDASLMLMTSLVAALALIGLADWLYWGTAWSSLRAIVDYTLVERQSSRGFEPFWYYVGQLTDWTNLPYFLLGALAFKLPDKGAALWTWVPILLLSLLPHNEARYAVPVLPFLCIAAAGAFQALLRRRLSPPAVTLALLALVAALVFEATNWRARRAADEIRLAQRIAALQPNGVAVEQLWRIGGPLYFRDAGTPLTEIGNDLEASLASSPAVILLLRSSFDRRATDALEAHGYHPSANLSTRRYVGWVRY
jgi:hypothetical protein